MKMRSTLIGLAFGSLLVAGGAQATGIQTNGNQFDNYNGSDVGCMERYASGIKTNCSYDTYMILGGVKLDYTTAIDVWVDGTHSGTRTTTLTTYAYDYGGTLIASRSNSASSVSGAWARLMQFSSSETTYYGYVSILARVPASYNGVIRGVGIYNL